MRDMLLVFSNFCERHLFRKLPAALLCGYAPPPERDPPPRALRARARAGERLRIRKRMGLCIRKRMG